MKPVNSNLQVTSDLNLKPSRKTGGNRVGVTTSGVAAQLRRSILEGEYAYQERLPAERNLAEAQSVREDRPPTLI